MTTKTIPALQWTDDTQLEQYATARHSHVYDDLGELGACFEQALRQSRFDLSFVHERFTDVHEWRTQVLKELKRVMVLPAYPRPVKARTLHRINCGNYARQEVEFESASGLHIPATVLIPNRGQAPFPAVIALHDMGAFRAFGREKLMAFEGEPAYLRDFRNLYYGGKSISLELVSRGFLVISIDSMMFGQRTPQARKDPEAFLRDRLSWTKDQSDQLTMEVSNNTERVASHSALLTGLNWAGMVASDDLATVDYLVSRPDVDARRIGCMGLSYGAYRANYLAALDDRIAAAVSVCWMATLDSIIGFNVGGAMGYFTLLPAMHTRLDLCDIASLASPRPFMAISGWQDQLMHPHGIAKAHRKLRAIWSKANARERLGSLCFNSPHEFNAAMQERAFAWMERWLGESN